MATQLYLSGVSAVSGGILDLNGANIELLPGWRPRVAKRRRGVLGGKRHEDVVESIPLRVYGASPADCVQFLELMAAAMDQARNWNDGAAVDVVILNYAINGTTLANPLQAAVLGTPADAADILDLPVTFNQNLQVFEVNPVTLPLERRGEWLGDEESDSSATVDNGELMTIDLTATTVPSPTVLRMGNFRTTGDNRNWGGYLLLAESAEDMLILNAEDSAGTTGFTSVADGTNFARNTNVLRYTPNNTNYRVTNLVGITTFSSDARLIGGFVNVRNTSADYYFNLRAQYGQFMISGGISSEPRIIPPGADDPLWYFLEPTPLTTELKSIQLSAQVENITGSPLLEIDTLVLIDLERVRVVALHEVAALTNWTATDSDIFIDHNKLTKPTPSVYFAHTAAGLSPPSNIGYDGIPSLSTSSPTLTTLYLSTGGSDPRHWRRTNNAGSAVQQLYTRADRRPAYLVPR